jgi:phosphonate transport system substrate-binding protein
MTRLPVALLVSAMTVLVTGCGAAPIPERAGQADEAAPASGRTLVIGSVSDDPEEEAEVFQPFIDHVATRLGDVGVTSGEVRVAPSIAEMADMLRSGEVDLYVDSMNGISSVVAQGAGVPMLRRWKDGAPEYHSVVVARRDSGITSVEQLRGHTVAFEEETSTDGYFLPAATLLGVGLPMTPVVEPSSPVAPDQVGYLFTGDDENTVFLVLDGRVDAGALSGEDLGEAAGSRADDLVVVTRTIDVPRHGVVGRTQLDPALATELTAVLGTLHETAEGRSVLEEFDGTERFDGLTMDDLAEVLEMRRVLDDRAP